MQSRLSTSHKMYLTLILSTVCIFAYQYQLSRARIISSSSNASLQQQQQQQLLQPIEHINVLNRELLKSAEPFDDKETTHAKNVVTASASKLPPTELTTVDVNVADTRQNDVDVAEKRNFQLNNEVAAYDADGEAEDGGEQRDTVVCRENADNNGCHKSGKQVIIIQLIAL
jgi:hypothetical protein